MPGGLITTDNTIELPGAELNRRLEDLSLKIERVSIMIEEAMVDPNATISLDRSAYHDLVMCLSRYDEFLSHLNETTLDVTDDLREIVGADECCYGEVDVDRDFDVADEEEEEDVG